MFYFCLSGISTLSQEDVPEKATRSALKAALEHFTRDLKRKFEVSVHEGRKCGMSQENTA